MPYNRSAASALGLRTALSTFEERLHEQIGTEQAASGALLQAPPATGSATLLMGFELRSS